MAIENEHDITAAQWETLKALRVGARENSGDGVDRSALAELVSLGLATLSEDGRPAITAAGRSVLLRGSPRLWDVAA